MPILFVHNKHYYRDAIVPLKIMIDSWTSLSVDSGSEMIAITFFNPASVPKKVTSVPVPASGLIENLHFENLKAVSSLPHEAKALLEIFCL